MGGFENLEVWKRAVEMSADVYRQLAQSNNYGFRDQITRSVLSIVRPISLKVWKECLYRTESSFSITRGLLVANSEHRRS